MAFHCWQAGFGSLSVSWMFYSDIYLDISYLIEVLLLYSTGLWKGWNSPSLMKWKERKNGDSTGFRPGLEFSSTARKISSWCWPCWKNRVHGLWQKKTPALICTLVPHWDIYCATPRLPSGRKISIHILKMDYTVIKRILETRAWLLWRGLWSQDGQAECACSPPHLQPQFPAELPLLLTPWLNPILSKWEE